MSGKTKVIIVALSLSLSACANFGYPDIDTTRKAIVVANAEIQAANLLLRDLSARNLIPDADALQALQALRDGHKALQMALDALTLAGDPATAQSRLEAATGALNVAITLLSAYVETGAT